MNKVILGGRLTKDPDVRTAGELKVVEINIATDKFVKGQRSADFHNCTAFGKTAEFIERFFHKGDFINIEGSNNSGSYTDKNGKKVYTYNVVINSAEFAGGKSSGGNTQQATKKADTGFINVPDNADDEGLPFA
jgi:single-strand DNA-binding protein